MLNKVVFGYMYILLACYKKLIFNLSEWWFRNPWCNNRWHNRIQIGIWLWAWWFPVKNMFFDVSDWIDQVNLVNIYILWNLYSSSFIPTIFHWNFLIGLKVICILKPDTKIVIFCVSGLRKYKFMKRISSNWI